MLFLTALVVALVAFALFCFAASLKVAATVFRNIDLRWKTAWLVAIASVALDGASSFLGHADMILGAPTGLAIALQLLTGIAAWVVPIVWIRKAIDVRFMRAFGLLVVAGILSVIISVSAAFAVRSFAFQAFKIPSGTMLPTLQVGDQLLAKKYVYRFREPVRGEVVIFKYPQDRSKDFIKRVIATGGESLEIRDKRIFINGKALEDPWGQHVDSQIIPSGSGDQSKRDNFGPIVVPAGTYFVMGDNRDRSFDSRFWGPVKREDIKGNAFILYWSEDSDAKTVRWQRIGKEIQ